MTLALNINWFDYIKQTTKYNNDNNINNSNENNTIIIINFMNKINNINNNKRWTFVNKYLNTKCSRSWYDILDYEINANNEDSDWYESSLYSD